MRLTMGPRPAWTSITAWAGFLLLLALHLDLFGTPRLGLLFGWIPGELAWRLTWMGLALAYLLFFCARIWREEEG